MSDRKEHSGGSPDVGHIALGAVGVEEFDYDEIDRRLGHEEPESGDPDYYLKALNKLFQWILNVPVGRDKNTNHRAIVIRMQAIRYHYGFKNQVQLGKEIGVGKAAISQKAVEFRDDFKIKNPAGSAANMRSDEARQTFSDKCKQNHLKRKESSSASNASPKRSTRSSGSLSDLRAKVLGQATRQ